ncbi:hypothetical protein [Sporosarcina sp. P7]|uniref:hypothetical protein n=1 Tax=Sporosarcina sp. P7 TaxID=2048244 RepID=UPI000C162837|nr:hypothetical protein [Sporosarcina sp. P7]PID24933.1 hypothetical protein CSV60_06640 [Sporosarcina sp. P7]
MEIKNDWTTKIVITRSNLMDLISKVDKTLSKLAKELEQQFKENGNSIKVSSTKESNEFSTFWSFNVGSTNIKLDIRNVENSLNAYDYDPETGGMKEPVQKDVEKTLKDMLVLRYENQIKL